MGKRSPCPERGSLCPERGSHGLGVRSLCPGRGSPCPGTGPRALGQDPVPWVGTPRSSGALCRPQRTAADLACRALAWDTHSRIPGGLIQSSLALPGSDPPSRTPVGSARGGLGGCGLSWGGLQVGARPSPGACRSPGALKAGPGELQPFPCQDLGPSCLAPTAPSPPGPCRGVSGAGSAGQLPAAPQGQPAAPTASLAPTGMAGSLLGHERKELPRVLLGLHHHIAI